MLKPDYDEIAEECESKADDIYKMPEADWTPTADKKGVQIHKASKDGSKLFIVRSKVVINVPVLQVTGIYNNKDLWKNWQPDLLVCKTIDPIWAGPNGTFTWEKTDLVDELKRLIN